MNMSILKRLTARLAVSFMSTLYYVWTMDNGFRFFFLSFSFTHFLVSFSFYTIDDFVVRYMKNIEQ